METINLKTYDIGERAGFRGMLNRALGTKLDKATADSLYEDAAAIRSHGRGITKALYEPGTSLCFLYNPMNLDSGCLSLTMALKAKYGDELSAVPYWLARRAVVEPVEMAVIGVPVRYEDVERLCGIFSWVGITPEVVWDLAVKAVCTIDAQSDSVPLNREARRARKQKAASRL